MTDGQVLAVHAEALEFATNKNEGTVPAIYSVFWCLVGMSQVFPSRPFETGATRSVIYLR